jgi:hypothetical protein
MKECILNSVYVNCKDRTKDHFMLNFYFLSILPEQVHILTYPSSQVLLLQFHYNKGRNIPRKDVCISSWNDHCVETALAGCTSYSMFM